MSTQSRIAALILVKNEAQMLPACLTGLNWCDEVHVLDTGSEDNSREIARAAGAQVHSSTTDSFAARRGELQQLTSADWLLYIDADERITPDLAQEITEWIADQDGQGAARFIRHNILYGVPIHHTGYQADYVTRLFHRTTLNGWYGEIHESPEYDGNTHQFHHPLIHLTHRSATESWSKSLAWTPLEAQLLYAAGTTPVTARTLFRKTVMEFWRRYILSGGWRDGTVGMIEALTQALNRFAVYTQVWELQQQPSPAEVYRTFDAAFIDDWSHAE